MSIKCMTWAFDQPVKSGAKLVLLALADFANDDGECWPSMDRIAVKASMSRSTLRRTMLELADEGYLETIARIGEDGRNRSNLYLLKMEGGGVQIEPLGVHSYDRGEGSTVDTPYEPSLRTVNTVSNTRARTSVKTEAEKPTSFPPLFILDETTQRVADELGFSMTDIHNELAAIADWSKNAGHKAKKRDWQAFVRNWLRKSKPSKPLKGKNHAPNTIAAGFELIDQAIAAERARLEAEAAGTSQTGGGQDSGGVSRLRQGPAELPWFDS